MTMLPFLCLGVGAFIGFRDLGAVFMKSIDGIINLTLVVLMMTIGLNIGVNDAIMFKLHVIGWNCVVIAATAMICSILLTILLEKTLLPLEKVSQGLMSSHIKLSDEKVAELSEEKAFSPLVFIMPASIISGILLGYFVMPKEKIFLLNGLLTGSLVVLYIGVGISLGNNRSVLAYIRQLGMRIVLLSVAIFVGSVVGGFVAGYCLGLSPRISVMASSGMSYYSLTGAYMTKLYGIETGTYGFVVNVMREFFTVLLLPLLIKISKGSAIASGAAGNMDTMLMPITKFVGPELGLVTLITGTILTFLVPFVLPLISSFL